uniref:uncharacterized protein LOC120339330 isoform X1 n=1 Tax=Styela clava TaxID=7725 RepID=UPI00193AA197|nr:uncharacterized protein LOC120339330 isoform X1 [Styela clava]
MDLNMLLSSEFAIKKYFVGAAFVIGGGLTFAAAYNYASSQCVLFNQLPNEENKYETKKILNEYMMFHYGDRETICKHVSAPLDGYDFPVRCAQLCVKHFDRSACSNDKCLEIGCAVGRSTFELARTFKRAVGLDYSHAFLGTCEVLSKIKRLEYEAIVEGHLTTKHVAVIPTDIDTSRCSFMRGDACNLPSTLGQFGCVLAANVICRLPDPTKFILHLKNIVAKGGICVITSPYTFLTVFTSKDKWLGGFTDSNGKEVRAFDTIKSYLLPDFELIDSEEMPYIIRETLREHQWAVAHATVWKRRSSKYEQE